jgi:hypothetical protein
MISDYEVYPYLLRTQDRIMKNYTTDTATSIDYENTNNTYFFIRKPPCHTNMFLLEMGDLYIRKFANTSTYARLFEIKLNFPSVMSYDSEEKGKSDTIGWASFNIQTGAYQVMERKPSQKVISFIGDDVFNLRFWSGNGSNIFQTDGTGASGNVMKDFTCFFHLKPIYPSPERRYFEGLPINYTLRSRNRIMGTNRTKFDIYIEKPNVSTNKFILDFQSLHISRYGQDATTASFEVHLNLPSMSCIDGNLTNSDTVSFSVYYLGEIMFYTTEKTHKKVITLNSSGIYSVLISEIDNLTYVPNNNSATLVFSLIPVYD